MPHSLGHKTAKKKAAKKTAGVGGVKKPTTWKGLKGVVTSSTESTGHTMQGRWSKKPIKISGPRSFSKDRTRQLLRQISNQVFWYIKKHLETTEQEVQAMWVNDRILISANLDSSMQALHGTLKSKAKKKAENTFDGILVTDWVASKRGKRHRRKLTDVVGGDRLDAGVPLADALRLAIKKGEESVIVVDISVPKNLAVLSHSSAKGKIVFIVGSPLPHAEQKLIDALVRANIKTRAEVFGKKRPCMGCYLTMLYAKNVGGFDLYFSDRPGGFWDKPLQNFLARIRELHKADPTHWDPKAAAGWFADQFPNYVSYKTNEGGKTVTDVDSESDSDYSSDED